MAIQLKKINVKFYLADDATLTPEDAFRIFNGWIPETTDEVLIDVADYTHVPQGPKTVLVGHEANYTLDDTDGRPGLRYGRKRDEAGDNAQRLRDAFAGALRACRRLEETTDDKASPKFRGGEALVLVNDRLAAVNDDATLAAVRGDLEALLDRLYPGAEASVERVGDERQRFGVRIRVDGEWAISDLLARIAD